MYNKQSVYVQQSVGCHAFPPRQFCIDSSCEYRECVRSRRSEQQRSEYELD